MFPIEILFIINFSYCALHVSYRALSRMRNEEGRPHGRPLGKL